MKNHKILFLPCLLVVRENFSEIHAEFSGRVATSIHEIVGDVVRDGDIVAKL